MTRQCTRQGCLLEAETEITLQGGMKEPSKHYLCMDHYLEVLTVAEMMRRLTGMPEIRTEPKPEEE